jgi:hypothetical protein
VANVSRYLNTDRPSNTEDRTAGQNAPVSILDSDDDTPGSPQSGEKRRHKDLALPSAPKIKKPDWTLDPSKV